MRTFLIITLPAVLIAVALLAVQRGWLGVPPQWNPWQPLDIALAPNFLTRYKLARLSRDGEQCRAVLGATAMQFEILSDRETGPGCGFHDAVRIRATPSDVGESFALSCRAAVALALWERHVVQPAAMSNFGQPVRRIDHFGSYACRNVYGRPDANRSRHATAEAWDVAGFVLGDGRRIRVVRDWQGEAEPAVFLRQVRTGACQFFDGVLSPDYNAAHRDHLHLDRGPYRICR
jgi:hypothetical protein